MRFWTIFKDFRIWSRGHSVRRSCTESITLRAKDAERFTEMIKATHTEEEAALITAAQDFAFLRTRATTV